MPTVAITDYTFPDLELERSILSAGGFDLLGGNNKEIPAIQSLVAEADAVITQFIEPRLHALAFLAVEVGIELREITGRFDIRPVPGHLEQAPQCARIR